MPLRPTIVPRRCARFARRLFALGVATLAAATADAITPISMVELNEGFSRAAAELVTDQAACNKLIGNPRNICREEARAKSLVTRAELELARTGTRKSQDYLTVVKLDTAFDVARALRRPNWRRQDHLHEKRLHSAQAGRG